MASVARVRGTWARGYGVTLTPAVAEALTADPGIRRALADGEDRRLDEPSELPLDADWYAVRERRRTVGALAIRRAFPGVEDAMIVALGIAPEYRGRACGTKALLLAERRLRAEGYARLLVRVPRTNGRGLYFMLRCGFTPVAERPEDAGDVTWFARREVE